MSDIFLVSAKSIERFVLYLSYRIIYVIRTFYKSCKLPWIGGAFWIKAGDPNSQNWNFLRDDVVYIENKDIFQGSLQFLK